MKIENKKIKNNNTSRIILKRSISVESSERLNERSKRLIERRRIDES
jgi:hypothetical protein